MVSKGMESTLMWKGKMMSTVGVIGTFYGVFIDFVGNMFWKPLINLGEKKKKNVKSISHNSVMAP